MFQDCILPLRYSRKMEILWDADRAAKATSQTPYHYKQTDSFSNQDFCATHIQALSTIDRF
jgi:hypothetical protein